MNLEPILGQPTDGKRRAVLIAGLVLITLNLAMSVCGIITGVWHLAVIGAVFAIFFGIEVFKMFRWLALQRKDQPTTPDTECSADGD